MVTFPKQRFKKSKIPPALRWDVWERDNYTRPSAIVTSNGSPILVSEVKSEDGKWSSHNYRFSKVHFKGDMGSDNDVSIHPGASDSGIIAMSDGIVCICGHYKAHHYSNRGYLGRCLWEWHGKTCDCSEFNEGGHGGLKSLVDTIVTSPPYQAEASVPTSPNTLASIKVRGIPYRDERADHEEMRNIRTGRYEQAHYDNIGNMRGPAYWEAMHRVYEQCHNVLADGGLMVLIVKGFVRNGVYQDLPAQTQELVERLGFVKEDEWLRELWSLSFWRILQKRKSPETFDDRLNFEVVQVYRKPAPGG